MKEWENLWFSPRAVFGMACGGRVHFFRVITTDARLTNWKEVSPLHAWHLPNRH